MQHYGSKPAKDLSEVHLVATLVAHRLRDSLARIVHITLLLRRTNWRMRT